MDRYVIREQRPVVGNLQANQMIAQPSTSAGGNNLALLGSENTFYRPVFPNAQCVNKPGFIIQNPGHIVPGIDACYLASYSGNSSSYIASGQENIQGDHNRVTADPSNAVVYGKYMNKNFVGPEKSGIRKYVNATALTAKEKSSIQVIQPKQSYIYGNTAAPMTYKEENNLNFTSMPVNEHIKKPVDIGLAKIEARNLQQSRFDKRAALYKSGARAFSGPVEKVLKWHKALQDVGVLILYEVVAKCVNVRAGTSCEKILVIRDENGPAMQVVYYEIDFLLPELKLPCTVRVVGRMLSGTCRLQAYHVRAASGDDVATLPRRAAVAQHHVPKLCKDYTTMN